MARFRTVPLACALLILPAFLLGGCGGGCCSGYDDDYGYYDPGYVEPVLLASVDLDNLSPEFVDTFFLAPAASSDWSEELLGWPLAPGETAYIGEFYEDWYDAEADTEFGDLVTWYDVWLPAAEITIFEVW